MTLPAEIERRFLVPVLPPRAGAMVEQQRQSYLLCAGPLEIRVRTTVTAGEQRTHELALKWRRSALRRIELQQTISPLLAILLHHCAPSSVSKERHLLEEGARTWELDVYRGSLDGLITAETELDDEHDEVVVPDWVGNEVTGDLRWTNRNLSRRGLPR